MSPIAHLLAMAACFTAGLVISVLTFMMVVRPIPGAKGWFHWLHKRVYSVATWIALRIVLWKRRRQR